MLLEESRDLLKLCMIKRKGVTLVFEYDEFGWDVLPPKCGVQSMTVIWGNQPIAITVKDEEGRSFPGNQLVWARGMREVESLLDVSAEHLRNNAQPAKALIATAETNHISRRTKDACRVDHRSVLGHRHERGKMTAGGLSTDPHSVGIEPVLRAVGFHPIDGSQRIIKLGRPAISATEEPVFHRGHGKAMAREIANHEVKSRVSVFPAPTVVPNDDRARFGGFRDIEVQVKGPALRT